MITDAEIRARLLKMRAEYDRQSSVIESESNLDFVDQLIVESEAYIMGEVVNLFNDLDDMDQFEEDVDWGEVNRQKLAEELEKAWYPPSGQDTSSTNGWMAVADRAIEILLEEDGLG